MHRSNEKRYCCITLCLDMQQGTHNLAYLRDFSMRNNHTEIIGFSIIPFLNCGGPFSYFNKSRFSGKNKAKKKNQSLPFFTLYLLISAPQDLKFNFQPPRSFLQFSSSAILGPEFSVFQWFVQATNEVSGGLVMTESKIIFPNDFTDLWNTGVDIKVVSEDLPAVYIEGNTVMNTQGDTEKNIVLITGFKCFPTSSAIKGHEVMFSSGIFFLGKMSCFV